MGLTTSEIRKELEAPRKQATINSARQHQNRLRFHIQTSTTPYDALRSADFFAFVSNILGPDKFKLFKTLFRFPIKTNEVTAVCFDKLSRIFDGRNPAYNYQFMNSEQRDDWEWYRQEVLHEPEVWATKGWEYFKTEINSVLVVDMPAEQDAADKYPAPYFYWLRIEDVISFEVDPKTGNMAWIIFRQDGDRIAVIDDERYRIFAGKNNRVEGEPLVESEHGLGYCPARFFWSEPINLQEPDVKASPITKVLESLDWFLFFHISKRHLDLFGAYPILSGYVSECDYIDSQSGDVCDNGLLKDKQGQYRYDSAGLPMRCPKCGDKRMVGAGTFVEIPIPDGEKQPDLRNPVQMLTVDRNSLDYNVAEEDRLRLDIITAVVGTNEQITTQEALNEQQVKANFESQSTVLNRIKRGMEAAQQFVDETICRLRYGAEFLSARINLGTEFYFLDATELRERYRMAKESGASEAELDALQNQIINTEYRNDPTQMQRMLTLAELEPFRHLSRSEVVELHEKGFVSEDDLLVKLNFANFVRRFERENTNVTEFGSAIAFDKKISIINQKFKEYASENRGGRPA